MAETAKILSPGKIVLLPDLEAGCSLADACPAEAFAAFRAAHPDHIAVSHINCSAAVKARSDLICTSSNAVDLVQQLPADRPILFAPDENLGRLVQAQSGQELTLCAEVLAQPECQQHLLDLADFIGSTSSFIVLTEPGILHQMRLNSLEKVWQCLDQMEPEIVMDEALRLRALAPIEKMLAMGR